MWRFASSPGTGAVARPVWRRGRTPRARCPAWCPARRVSEGRRGREVTIRLRRASVIAALSLLACAATASPESARTLESLDVGTAPLLIPRLCATARWVRPRPPLLSQDLPCLAHGQSLGGHPSPFRGLRPTVPRR
jgi:hypothetical protein